MTIDRTKGNVILSCCQTDRWMLSWFAPIIQTLLHFPGSPGEMSHSANNVFDFTVSLPQTWEEREEPTQLD